MKLINIINSIFGKNDKVKTFIGFLILIGIIVICVFAFKKHHDTFESNDDSMTQKGGGLSDLEKNIIGITGSIGIAGIIVFAVAIYKHRRNSKIYPQQ